jgi:MFS family permease
VYIPKIVCAERRLAAQNEKNKKGAGTMSGKSIVKTAVIASAGATIEWYDFFVYGTAAALVFPKLFFPATLSPFVAQLAAFSTFAVGFIARPFGGALFGHFGDLFGRKRALVAALVAMGLATTLVGFLPSYAVAGAIAPLLLILLRVIQGFAVGGQWGGAALLAIESAPPGRQGLFGSLVQIGVPAGVVLANVVFLLVSANVAPEDFASWGWRIPFLLSIVLVGIGVYVQLRLEETPEFKEMAADQKETAPLTAQKSPVMQALRRHPQQIVLAGGAFVANNTCFYIAITYVVAYGTTTLHVTKSIMLMAVMFGSLLAVPSMIISGHLSDLWGRRGLFMVGAVLSGLWAFAMFPMIETGSAVLITTAITIELVLLCLMYGPQAALFAELFPVDIRYSGVSLGYQVGSVVGGGFAPIVATALFERFQSSQSIAWYMFATCVVSFISVFLLTRPNKARAYAPVAGT